MDIITLDFETFWDVGHSLSKMPPTEYVMHPETEIISVAIKINDGPTRVMFGEEKIKAAVARFDWSKVALLGHNMSGFDAMICAWRLGMRPRMWMCTAAMARPLHAKTCGVSLAKLVKHYGLGEKDNTALLNTKGRHLKDFTPAELAAMKEYNKNDTDQCYELFLKLRPHYSAAELWQIHQTAEMLVNPQFELDIAMLESTLDAVRKEKHDTLVQIAAMLGITKERVTTKKKAELILEGAEEPAKTSRAKVYENDDERIIEAVKGALASAPKFAQLLDHLNVPVPLKESGTQTNEDGSPVLIPALAKSDEAFLALQEHENPLVAHAAMARLSVKSTLLETRLEKFIRAGLACDGMLPVPLKCYGADTTGRWSGEQYNCQNLPAIRGKPKLSDALRLSMRAPRGKKVVVADLSGIELRVNHFLWKVPYSTKLYKAKPDADLYRAAGAIVYACREEDISKEQRQLEKVKALGLGFGAAALTFMDVARTMGGVILTQEEAEDAVKSWRSSHREIVQGWYSLNDNLMMIEQGREIALDPWGLTHTSKEGIHLPSGRIIRYPDLRREVNAYTGRDEWVYAHGRHKARLYGGKCDENIVQALARDVIADHALEFYKRTRLTPALMVHDELVYVVDEDKAESLLEELQTIMRTPSKWWPDLVTWSEGDVADSYGEAK